MKKGELKRCTRCLLPHTVTDISFDENGICSVCTDFDRRERIDFRDREEDLIKLFDRYRGKGKYDCLVPYSGGKDSTYVLYICKKYGMTPLAYNFNNHFQSAIGKENMENMARAIGADLISYAPNWKVAKRMCIRGIEDRGDFCWFCNCGGFATSAKRGIIEGISLIVFGEDFAVHHDRFDSTEMFVKIFKDACQHGVPETKFVDEEVTLDALEPYVLPEKVFLRKVQPIYLGSYIKWDKFEILEFITKQLGWKGAQFEDGRSNFEHIDCKYAGVKEYMKFLKRGYATNTENASEKIRSGRISREEGQREIKRDGMEPRDLDEFLNMVGMTKEAFCRIVLTHKKY